MLGYTFFRMLERSSPMQLFVENCSYAVYYNEPVWSNSIIQHPGSDIYRLDARHFI